MNENSSQYIHILSDIKDKIKSAQYRAIIGANKEMILLYWQIGQVILQNIEWGNKFIENLSRDIRNAFPDATGYSVRNLKYMRKFAEEFSNFEFVQQAVAQINWRHVITLMNKSSDLEIRSWYVAKTIENGWSANVLALQMSSQLYERQAIADKTHNFDQMLPHEQSDLVAETMKDPYIFEFISMSEELRERDIEKLLVQNVTKLLLELGSGFAFVGNQYHLSIGNEDFYLDLLFYNYKLRCFVVIELKTGSFKPEHAGKLNFYLSAVDDLLKTETDNPSIGILLCRDKNKLIAEYALKDMTKPIGVSEFRLLDEATRELGARLPEILKTEMSAMNIES